MAISPSMKRAKAFHEELKSAGVLICTLGIKQSHASHVLSSYVGQELFDDLCTTAMTNLGNFALIIKGHPYQYMNDKKAKILYIKTETKRWFPFDRLQAWRHFRIFT